MLQALRDRLAHGRMARRVAANSGWLVADRVIRLGVGLVVGAWVARHLGPSDSGRLAYATAIAGLFVSLAEFGLEGVTVRALVARPDAAGRILGSAFAIRFAGGLVGIAAACLAAWFLRPGEADIMLMVALIASTFVITPLHVAEFLFQARLANRVPVVARFAAFLATNILRIALIFTGASVIAFSGVPLFETAAGAVALLIAFRWSGIRLRALSYDRGEAANLAQQGLPFVAAGLATLIATRADQLLVGELLGDSAVGIYSASVRLVEASQFALAGLAMPLLPAMVALRSVDPERYRRDSERLFTLLFAAGLAAAAVLSIASTAIVEVLYGQPFIQAARVLSIQAWSLLFSVTGVAIGHYLIADGMNWFALVRALAALAGSVFLNILLLPRVGVVGAGWAALGSSMIAICVLLFPTRTRPLGLLLVSAMVARWIFRKGSP